MKLFLIAAALALFPIASSAAPEPAATVDAFHAAVARGDAAAASALLDNHAVVFEQGDAEWGKAQYVAEHLPADVAFAATVKEEVLTRSSVAAGEIAYVVTDGRLGGVFQGKPVNCLTKETMILRWAADAWLIVHIHWSSAAR